MSGFDTAITGAGFASPEDAGGDPFGLSSLGGAFGAGAGFADPLSPPSDISWELLSKNPYYSGMSGLSWLPNLDQVNFSDAFVDLDKFGVNYNTPLLYPGQVQLPPNAVMSLDMSNGGYNVPVTKTDEWGNQYTAYEPVDMTPRPQVFGDVQLLPSGEIQKLQDGQWGTVDQWGQYDRDPSDIMGWIDPRHKLIFEDAPGWNDPLSNWLQEQGEGAAADLLGRLSFGARRGDSSSAGYSPETWWVQNMSPEDAQKVFGMKPEDYTDVKNWANDYFSAGAQSARHDAMFGGSFFDDILGIAAPILSFIPGMQPLGVALSALNAVQSGSPLALLSAGLGLSNLGSIGNMALSDFADFGWDGLSSLSDSLSYATPSFSLPTFDWDSPLASMGKLAGSGPVKLGTKAATLGLREAARDEGLDALMAQLQAREMEDSPEVQRMQAGAPQRWAGYANY